MELIVAFFITGILIIVATIWNRRKFREHLTLQTRMELHFDTSGMNLSSSAEYKNCFSFQWVIDNLVNRTHGVYGSALQDFLMDNTLLAVFVLGIILSVSSMMIAIIFLTSIIAIGAATAVFFVGLLVIMGPSGPKTSELLLNAIHKRDLEDLKREDYVYVKLAVESIKKWIIISVGRKQNRGMKRR